MTLDRFSHDSHQRLSSHLTHTWILPGSIQQLIHTFSVSCRHSTQLLRSFQGGAFLAGLPDLLPAHDLRSVPARLPACTKHVWLSSLPGSCRLSPGSCPALIAPAQLQPNSHGLHGPCIIHVLLDFLQHWHGMLSVVIFNHSPEIMVPSVVAN